MRSTGGLMSNSEQGKAYLVGGGIASLSAAILPIRDGGFPGRNIRIIEGTAVLGQYVEIPEDVVFTVEYSVRGAMHAVYGLLGLNNKIPPIYHGISDPKVAMASLRTLMS